MRQAACSNGYVWFGKQVQASLGLAGIGIYLATINQLGT